MNGTVGIPVIYARQDVNRTITNMPGSAVDKFVVGDCVIISCISACGSCSPFAGDQRTQIVIGYADYDLTAREPYLPSALSEALRQDLMDRHGGKLNRQRYVS